MTTTRRSWAPPSPTPRMRPSPFSFSPLSLNILLIYPLPQLMPSHTLCLLTLLLLFFLCNFLFLSSFLHILSKSSSILFSFCLRIIYNYCSGDLSICSSGSTMMLSPVQIFMDSSDWTQNMMQDRGFRPSSSGAAAASGGEDLLSCSRPLLERGLNIKPQPEQALKCPRCDSINTKFCYYNNYSLSQPRHFCKTCRRYWTKGGALRTVPVGGGCRKNKKTKRASSAEQAEPSTSGAPPLSNPNPNMFFNSSTSNDMNAFARGQAVARYGDQSASDFLGLSCGPSTTQSSFGPLTLNPISSLTNMTPLSFPSLGDFPVISKGTSSAMAPPPDWQLPPEPTLLDPNINFWSGGSWPDLPTYGSSSM